LCNKNASFFPGILGNVTHSSTFSAYNYRNRAFKATTSGRHKNDVWKATDMTLQLRTYLELWAVGSMLITFITWMM